jgi:death-associated protein 6
MKHRITVVNLSHKEDNMANVANDFTQKSSKNQSNFEVITLSSDEEQSDQSNVDVNFLFKRFILACRPHVTKEAIKDARSLFTEVEEKLTKTHDLVATLDRYSKEIKKTNADLYLSMICSSLSQEKSRKNKSAEVKSIGDNLDGHKVAKSVTFCDVIAARGFEPKTELAGNENNKPSTSTADIATISDDDDFVSKTSPKKKEERIATIPSTSTKGKISTKTLTENQKKKLVRRLRQRLKEINNEIKILNRAELTLEEMDMSDSTYIKESRLKKRFEKTWNKICQIQGRAPNTGRVVEKVIRASSTGYSMIDKAVAKFLKEKKNSFPDYFDIRDIVMKANQKHDLRMSTQALNGIIADIFTDIGNKLQRRRERDLLYNFGSHLLDDFNADNDPALCDEDLANQLEKNRRISKRNLKHVYAKYTHLERFNYDDKRRMSQSPSVEQSVSSTANDEENADGSRKYKKYTRLDPREVMGKSIMKGSREFDGDISSESSENEEDVSGIQEDTSVVVEDSDVTSSQEICFVSSTCKPDMSSPRLETRHVFTSSDIDQLTMSSDNISPGSPTYSLACPSPVCHKSVMSEQPASTFEPGDTKTQQETVVSTSDCEIINDPNEQKPATPPNDLSAPESQTSASSDGGVVNEPVGQLVARKHLEKPVNERPEFDISSNTESSDCEIVNNPKQQSVTMKQLDEPAKEPGNEPTPDNDCLIIEDDPPIHRNPMKIPTSAPSEAVTRTINVLLDVFRKRSKTVDQSKDPVSSCDRPVGKTVPNTCVSQTSTPKDWESTTTGHNMDDQSANGISNAKSTTLHSDNDVMRFVNDQCSDSRKDGKEILSDCQQNPKLVTCQTIPSSSSPSKHRDAVSTETSRNVNKNIASNSSHSPSNPGSCRTDDQVNPRKRKAPTELSLQIPKASMKCLEQIAWSLKNKKLKLPNGWVSSSRAEKNIRDVSPPKPKMSTEPPTVSSASFKPTTSKEPSTVISALFEPITSKESSSIAPTLHENNSQLMKSKARIDLQQRQVFREKILNAFKTPPTKPVCNNNVNSASTTANKTALTNISVSTSNNVDNADISEVIIIDD